MKRKNTFRLIIALACLSSSLLYASPGIKAEIADDKYRIGAILPLSGSAASLGEYLKKGLDLAYQRLPAEKKAKIELIYEDDQLKSTSSISAFQRLKSQNNVDAVFVLGSGIGNALAPLTERSGVVLVAIGASDGGIAKDRKYAFVHWVTPEVEATEMAREIKKRGYKRLAIVSTEQEGAYAVLKAVKQAFNKQGLSDRLIAEQAFLPGETDFRTYLAKMKSLKTDAVIVILFPGALASFAKQSKEISLEADLAGIELFEDENEVKASEGALVGHWYVNADVATESFQQLYRDEYNEHPGWGVANAFDTLNLLSDAISATDQTNDAIAEYLATLKGYSGAAGVYSATGDNRFELPATIKVVEKNGFAKLYK